ncbi:hypothetical protein DRE_04132 [Drechslerella stenobrocha 248]|uniref:PCI domain-containing protein n=1 Tax=Drechslerella stenobrocha 248 TaxID=1043628 RepID=W7IC30_9PEZI|nr:hypothetical protein DRE_04132 [Drechslerella stenobrocha 248]
MADVISKVLKWRWLAKRVFSPFSSSPTTSSPSITTSPSKPPTEPPPTASSSSSPSSPPAPSYSYWPFAYFFRARYSKATLLLPPPKELPEEDSSSTPPQEPLPPPHPHPTTTTTAATPATPPRTSTPGPLPSPPATVGPVAPISPAVAPLQLPTPPATPELSHSPPSRPSPSPQVNRQHYLSHLPPLPPIAMADLSSLHAKLVNSFTSRSHQSSLPLLATAKLTLLKINALIPSPSTSPQTLSQARDILEIGALTSIYLSDTESFNRYYNYLQPFYKLPTSTIQPSQQESKILGLYLLFLLSQGDSAGFHTALEVLNQEGTGDSEKGWQWGEYVRYPVTLERWLMEGSYDKVWEATRKSKTPTEEFDVFTKILVSTLRQEIATSAQRAYPSLPISNAKNLLFLDTEKEVLQFARERDWDIRDGRIYFPLEDEYDGVADVPDSASIAAAKSVIHSGAIIENTIGYANELEQIV